MNRTVVRRAAAGLAAWLAEHGYAGRPVVVGFDARHGSADFARDSAEIFAAAGFDARLMPAPLPTPVTAFAVQRLGAAAGVMVTASHNPPQDNGYKVYADDGAQIVPPADREIEAAIRAVRSARAIPLDDDAGDRARRRDRRRLRRRGRRARRRRPARPARSSTPRCTVSARTSPSGCSRAAGFAPLVAVPEQERPDPDFPTVAFPNPEEPGALDLSLALAGSAGADLVIANDPDADRCAVAVPDARRHGACCAATRSASCSPTP